MVENSAQRSGVPTGAEDIHWDLGDLYRSIDDLEKDLERARIQARDFRRDYRGRVVSLEAQQLAESLRRLEELHELLGRAGTYAYLHWSTNSEDPARGALLQRVREISTEVVQQVLFFDLELVKIDDERFAALLPDPQLTHYRHYLEVQRLFKPHLLSEPEEKILSEKALTGAGAWARFFDETLSAARFPFRQEKITEQEILSKLYDPDRAVRRDGALGFTEGLKQRLRELTYCFNTLLADKASDDKLRNYKTWISSRNLANEIRDETVEALVSAVTSRYDLVKRFYQLKRELLGLDELTDFDRYAPLGETDRVFQWSEARGLVTEAYHSFHPRFGSIAAEFFEKNWIDAAVTPGKRGGAFSHAAVPSAHPYILMNFTGKLRDVQTLAHELGHGVHQYLSRPQGALLFHAPLTTAETASVFGEMLVFQRVLAAETDPRNKLAMLVSKIDDSMATIFRQVTMNRFEEAIHNSRRAEGELSSDRFSELWVATQEAMFQGSVRLGEHYRVWWSYVPHFLHTPGYVYAYAFGELLVLALYARYRAEGSAFADGYLQLLSAGGSDWPHVLVAKLGVDLEDVRFWEQGLSAIEELVDQAESLAQSQS
jgi:oligoendopeptidase F